MSEPAGIRSAQAAIGLPHVFGHPHRVATETGRGGFEFDGERFANAFRADLLVEGCVLVEVKSVVELTPVYFMQVRTYLRLLNYPVGLLINFNVDLIKRGIKRMINDRSPHGSGIRLRLHDDAGN